jgi:hypothetical protein
MGLEHLKEVAEPARTRLREALALVQIGLSVAFIAAEASWLLPVFSEITVGQQPWLQAIALGCLNSATAAAAIGFLLCMRSLDRSWGQTSPVLACIVLAACICAFSTCRSNYSPVLLCFLFLFASWFLQSCSLALFLRALRPLVQWDLDEKLARFVLETAANTKAALSRGNYAIRRIRRQDVAWTLRRVGIAVASVICFDLSLLCGCYLVDRLVYPTFFGVMPTERLVWSVIQVPFLLAGGMGLIFVLAIACGMGFVSVLLVPIHFQASMLRTSRLRRDLAWDGHESGTPLTTSLSG